MKGPDYLLLDSGSASYFKISRKGGGACNWKQRSKIVKDHSEEHSGLVICVWNLSLRHMLPSNYGCRQK